MARLANGAKDAALDYIRDRAQRMDICSSEPSNYEQATSTYSLGYSNSVVLGSTQTVSGNDREAQMSAIDDGVGTATGTATYFALTSDSDSELLYTQTVSNSQVVASGNTWTLSEHGVRINDPT